MTDALRIPTLAPREMVPSFELISTTMGALGNNLPHGILTPNGRECEIEFLPPNVGMAKKRGELKHDVRLAQKVGQLFCSWLGISMAQLGPYDFRTEKNPKQRAIRVAEVPFADVLYLMLAWYRHARPKGYELKGMSCGRCEIDWPHVTVQFDTLKVTALPSDASRGNPPQVSVGLEHGFEYQGKHVSTVLLQPPRFLDHAWLLTQAEWDNDAILVGSLVEASIIGVDTIDLGLPFRMPPGLFDAIHEDDFNLMQQALGLVTPTLDLRIDIECPTCGAMNEAAVDWRSPSFLSAFTR